MEKKKNRSTKSDKISRKEAIKKGSKYAALTAATMLFLTPQKAAAQSRTTRETPRTGDGYRE